LNVLVHFSTLKLLGFKATEIAIFVEVQYRFLEVFYYGNR
jgi:hypothetical protein